MGKELYGDKKSTGCWALAGELHHACVHTRCTHPPSRGTVPRVNGGHGVKNGGQEVWRQSLCHKERGRSDLNCHKCVWKDISRPQKFPRHSRPVLKASSAGHTGKFGLQRL